MKKLPIGIQTFSEIRQEGYCYVDKTPLIQQLAETGKYYFLARPRRFGKSLLVSTLHAAFAGRQALFKGLYLEAHWDWRAVYPVIAMGFGRGIIESREVLDERINAQLQECANLYDVVLTHRDLANRFAELIVRLNEKFSQRVVVLIDEYDKPILDNIDRPDLASQIRDGLKNFYSVIKDSDAHVKFALLTGVSKFSKVSLFSGLNNLKDITLDPRYATLCGYTENEILDVFADYLSGVDIEQLRLWYNGYNFLGERVYNPYDVLLYLDQRTFKNYWFETGSPGFLIKLVQQKQYSIPQLEDVRASESLLSSFDVESIELETLLFQTGYLTIQSVEQQGQRIFYRLNYPNLEVKMSLMESLLNMLVQQPAERERNLSMVYAALENEDFELLKQAFHAFFATIPHDWYRKNQLAGYEGYYASIVYCYFAALGLDVTAEDSTNHGRIDLTVKLDNRVFLIEFKVIDQYQAAGDALRQIKAKNYQDKFINRGLAVYLLGVSFNKADRNIVDFFWEQCDC
ncbi:MAG: hypothetical protein CVV06_15920 [Gammaproteobacteria bacterium HGW-Gammaproteobacteria-10]|nr:MAG: hypothetical protein CVV06_15920 [Gammaproteobacteria bacterium HGW-Gammaproteobacteria-10]